MKPGNLILYEVTLDADDGSFKVTFASAYKCQAQLSPGYMWRHPMIFDDPVREDWCNVPTRMTYHHRGSMEDGSTCLVLILSIPIEYG